MRSANVLVSIRLTTKTFAGRYEMETTTIVFTLWIGSFSIPGTNDVFIGRACASNRNCEGIRLVRPTFDTTFEVVVEDETLVGSVP